jgi:hypothetical protein
LLLNPVSLQPHAPAADHGGMNAQAAHRPLRHARDYAQAIVEAHGNVDRQREIFASCPLELRAMVRDMAKRALAEAELRASLGATP